MIFRVIISEIWKQAYQVEATSKEEAVQIVLDGEPTAKLIEDDFELAGILPEVDVAEETQFGAN